MQLIELRHVGINDAELLFNWANDPEVRKNAIHTEKIMWDTHLTWLNKKLLTQESTIYIGTIESIAFGQIRFDRGLEYFTIDYSIDQKFRGRGLGKKLIDMGIKKILATMKADCTFIAYVRPENHPSCRVFENCGFTNMGNTILEANSLVEYGLKICYEHQL